MTTSSLTAAQVAARLGVRPQTVYAYVSRGILTRQVALDGRTSLFDPAQVEELARRGRPRQGQPRPGGVDVVLASSITRLEPDRLLYRGQDAAELAVQHTFEDAAELLWTGQLDGAAHTWARQPGVERLVARATAVLPALTPADVTYAVATATVAAVQPLRGDLRPATVIHHARTLLATLAGCRPPVDGATASASPRVAGRLWPTLSPLRATGARLRLLDAALVLLADHELATSTLAARVAASTRADPHAAVLSGLGAVAGPLHGRAGRATYALLLDAADSGTPDAALARAIDAGRGHLPGFGHAVYTGDDPRAMCLLGLIAEVGGARQLATIDAVRTAATDATGLRPNIDFALGALALTTRMEPGGPESIFVLARVAGWVAHVLEEYEQAPLRFRARAISTSADVAAAAE